MGWQNLVVVRALQIIVSSGGTGQGVFVYSGTPAAGNGPVFSVTAPGVTTDPFGNSVANVLQVGQNSGGHLQIDQFGELIAYDSSGHQTIFLNPQNQYVAIYSPTLATGNLKTSLSAQVTTDTASNTVQQGLASYNGNIIAQVNNGGVGFQFAAGQIAGGFQGTIGSGTAAGQVIITSGGNSISDTQAEIILDSASVAGASFINLDAVNVQLDTFATSTIPSANVFPGHQSAAPAAYNQAYEQASTNRINQIMDVLTQCGIWHT